MTNRVALFLAAALVAAAIVDFGAFGGTGSLFLGRKLVVLVDWIAFWR